MPKPLTDTFSLEDRFARTVLEESYLSDGTGAATTGRLIDRKTHTYSDGRLTTTRRNGRLSYEAGYNPDGTLHK